jgi:nicotinamide-nucleotide amidase
MTADAAIVAKKGEAPTMPRASTDPIVMTITVSKPDLLPKIRTPPTRIRKSSTIKMIVALTDICRAERFSPWPIHLSMIFMRYIYDRSPKFYAIFFYWHIFFVFLPIKTLPNIEINQRLVNPVKDWMLLHNETIAVAESVSSGLLQLLLSSADQAMDFYQGGITAYNLGQKSRHLLVDPIHALSCSCVSAKVSAEMALNVCRLFTSNWGIGITGYASPVPESGNKLFAYYAIARNGEIIVSKKIDADKDEPAKIQLLYVENVLKELAAHLLSR